MPALERPARSAFELSRVRVALASARARARAQALAAGPPEYALEFKDKFIFHVVNKKVPNKVCQNM